jgi:hypothetical protein
MEEFCDLGQHSIISSIKSEQIGTPNVYRRGEKECAIQY